MTTIVGLGNPGKRYEGTRHNVGRFLVESLRTFLAFPEWKEEKSARALVAEGEFEKQNTRLVLPETFMNESGASLRVLFREEKETELIVVHDDIDLPLGTLRISYDRGAGGQKGILSIMHALGHGSFTRIRVGIAPTLEGAMRKPPKEAVPDFVLTKFSPEEKEIVENLKARVSDAISSLIREGREKAMNKFN